jgi:hypothetical protein
MHQEFEDLFQQLYVGWADPAALQPVLDKLTKERFDAIVEDTRKAIDEAEANQSAKLRTDAKLFLLVNFIDMVLFPISFVREKRSNDTGLTIISEEKMRSDLKHDIREIIKEAVNKKNREVADLPWPERNKPEHREISGHNVIDAISNVWNEMKFNDYIYWAG